MMSNNTRFPVAVRAYMAQAMVDRLTQEADRLSAEHNRRVGVAELIRTAVDAFLDQRHPRRFSAVT